MLLDKQVEGSYCLKLGLQSLALTLAPAPAPTPPPALNLAQPKATMNVPPPPKGPVAPKGLTGALRTRHSALRGSLGAPGVQATSSMSKSQSTESPRHPAFYMREGMIILKVSLARCCTLM